MKILSRFLPRRSPPPSGRPAAASPGAVPARPTVAPASLSPEEAAAVTERRAATLRSMFPLLFSRHARRADLWQAIVIERYLSQSANLADLEHRILEVQRRRQFSWSE